MRQPGRTFASEEILQAVKGFSPVPGSAQAAVRVYISRLRQKIESDPKRPRYLQTVRGVGYRFTP
jgi:DNA-binding response OmpR family regulator